MTTNQIKTNGHLKPPEINKIEGDPSEVIGIINIKSRTYALVRWQPYGKVYVPYEFMKKFFPMMIVRHYQKQSTFRPFVVSKPKRRS